MPLAASAARQRSSARTASVALNASVKRRGGRTSANGVQDRTSPLAASTSTSTTPWGPSKMTARAPLSTGSPCRWATSTSFGGSMSVMDENRTSDEGSFSRTAPATRLISSPVRGSRGWAIRAASRAAVAVVASAVSFVSVLVSGAEAQGPGPACPAALDGQPLSMEVPFSGTLRSVAGPDGEVTATSLRCAYGEGVAPAADLTLTWGGDCGHVAATSAPRVETADLEAAGAALVAAVGGRCTAATVTAGVPVTTGALA